MENVNELCDTIRETAYAIHLFHGHGHFEKVYENALAHRLRKLGFDAKQQHPIRVLDEDGSPLGDYQADLQIGNKLIVEIKACRSLTDEHAAQLLGYLKATRTEHGLLVNFGSFKFEIRKFVLSQGRRLAPAGSIVPVFFALLALFCAS